MVQGKFQNGLQSFTGLLGLVVEYKELKKRKLESYPKACQQQAEIVAENLLAIGAGNSRLAAREDAARQLLLMLLENYLNRIKLALRTSQPILPSKVTKPGRKESQPTSHSENGPDNAKKLRRE